MSLNDELQFECIQPSRDDEPPLIAVTGHQPPAEGKTILQDKFQPPPAFSDFSCHGAASKLDDRDEIEW